jgi:hypothetical protein
MAELQYLDNFNNPTATNTIMNVGDYLVSPSGVYNGVLNPSGTFTVSYGNVPNTQPVLWTSDNPGVPGPYWVQSLPWFGTSQYYVFAPCNCTNPSGGHDFWTNDQLAVNQNYATAPDFMQLNDSGQLVIYQGNNGVKTNANENPVQTRTPGKSVAVTSLTLNTITYDTAHTVYNALNKVVGLDVYQTNNTAIFQSYPYDVSLEYTDSETFSWDASATLSASISSSTKVAVPVIGEQEETVDLTAEATISHGQSTTQTTTETFSAGGTTNVPAHSEYAVHVTAYDQVATVPYTWTGIAYYANGYSAPINGSGTILSDTTGVFSVETDCISTPSGCPGGAGSPLSIPEPPALVTVPLAFAALLVLTGVRKRWRSAGLLQPAGLIRSI